MTMTADELATLYRERIQTEQLKPGDKLPSLTELQKLHGVGPGAANAAVQKLRASGLIESRQGAGNFVKQPPSKASVTDNWADAVLHGSDPNRSAHILRIDKVAPPPFARDALALPDGELAVMRHARVDFHGAPAHVEWVYYPPDLAFESAIVFHDTGEGGVYARLAERGAVVDRYVEFIEARLPLPAEVPLLKVRADMPVFEVTRLVWAGERVVEAGRAVLIGGLYQVVHETVLRER